MASRIRAHTIDLGLGLLLTAFLALGLEALVRALGAAPPAPELSRGFDARARYLTPDPELAGGFVTQFSDGRFEERRIPARGALPRLILLGGSNTQGFPAPALALYLEQLGQPWEVVNLGRQGYGSARVAILAEQALELLDPDLLVVYSGHNEFVEKSFRLDVGTSWQEPLWRAVQHSALVRLAAETLAPAAGARTRRPEAWAMEYAKFKGISYAETQLVYGAYRENLAGLGRRARDKGVPVLLCTVVHNLYAAPFESTLPPDLGARERAQFELLHARARALLPAFLAPLLPAGEIERVLGRDWEAGPTRQPLPAPGLGWRPSLGELALEAPGHPPPEGWNPKVWALLESLDRLHARRLDGGQRAQLEAAEADLRAALQLVPDHPLALFELGLVQELLGREVDAIRRSLRLAARYDRAPRKASDATNDILREVAASVPGVLLLDAEQLFADRVPAGLVGWEWMVDHCHIVAGAKRVLLRDIARAIVAEPSLAR